MDFKRFGDKYILRLEKGEELVESLTSFIKQENIKLGRVSGLGAVDEAEIGLFYTKEKQYHSKQFKEDMEIVSLTGNISTMKGEHYLHLHISIGDKDLKVYGGHLNRAVVSVTAEIIIDVIDGEIDRELDEKIGVNLIKF